MSCGCEIKHRFSELEYVRSMAKKAARMEGVVYVIYRKNDGTYSFDRLDGFSGTILEYVHYL